MPDDKLRKRVLEISYKNKLCHLGSCLSALSLIDDIYATMAQGEIFVLSCGHAGLALYAVKEKYGKGNAEELLKKSGIHPDAEAGFLVSTGSLGHGLPIAVGLALADRDRKVSCLISDGECAEGSIWEALSIAEENNLTNLEVIVNANGYGAYKKIDPVKLKKRLKTFFPNILFIKTTVEQHPALSGLDAHYHILTEDEYKSA